MPTRNENITYARSELQSSLDQNPVQKFRILGAQEKGDIFISFFGRRPGILVPHFNSLQANGYIDLYFLLTLG